jgi:predicted Fe-Mo cluster-binding NifX family protein
MNICIPVTEDKGLQSPTCEHFGAAPVFLIVDTESRGCRAIPNRERHHGHGMCRPLALLAGEKVDAMVVGGIGRGALGKLQAADIRVYLSQKPTVEETLSALRAGALPEVTPETACGHHGGGHHGHHGQGGGGHHRL